MDYVIIEQMGRKNGFGEALLRVTVVTVVTQKAATFLSARIWPTRTP